MNNVEKLFGDLKSGHYEDIDIYLNKAIEEYNQLEKQDFWNKWVYPTGANTEEIKNELLDYHEYMIETAKVYMYFTNNNISKVNTKADIVINEIERFWEFKTSEQRRLDRLFKK